MSLKLAVGFMKPNERMRLHARKLEEKIADLNLVAHPNLIIIDGRKCFISGGPACGEIRNPNVVMASGDRVALDVEAVKVIKGYEGTIKNITQNKKYQGTKLPPFLMEIINAGGATAAVKERIKLKKGK